AAWLAGLLPDAVAHNRQRLDVARRRGDQEAESAALRLEARLAWESGDTDETVRVTEQVATLAERLPDGHERGMALAVVAQSAMLRDDLDGAVHWADRALELADRVGDEAVRAHAMVEKGSALVTSPDERGLGAEMLCDAADLGERLGDDVVVARALHNLVRTDSRPRDAGLARRRLERMRAAAERAGFDSMAGTVHAQGLADLAEWEGDLDAAMQALADGRCGDRGYLFTAKGSWFGVHEAGLALEAGDVEKAVALTDSLRGAAGSKASWFAGLAAHVACRIGDVATARSEIARLAELGGDPGRGRLSGMMVHDVVAAALRVGIAPEELHPLAVRITPPPGGKGDTDPTAARAFVDAQLAEAAGDHEAACAGYATAGAAEISLYPYERGTAVVGLARCLIARGDLEGAREQVALAEQLLEHWRGWRVDELDAVRRRLGMTTGAVVGPAALTPREREVVALVAEGLTNAELAARLYISPKTAAVHVSNVLAKLGMSSRTEVAAWAIREQLTAAAPD
ncbi:MAG: LuxR family transcriptional regulator, partial [Acidimicrobiia bacterium]|nr:LuxR family transcriptional regulator [Acidimicrobiia bacterium]